MIAIVLQFHTADRTQALELARFIADLEPVKRHDVRFRFVARGDCEQADMDTIQYVAQKFDVSWVHAKTKAEGWPAGPNALACEILLGAPKWLHETGWQDAVGVLMLEPDTCPLSRDWLDVLIHAWDFALLDQAWCMGSWRHSGGQFGHINGNAIYVPDFGRRAHLEGCPKDLAWDCWAANFAHKHWCKTGLIRNDFGLATATEGLLRVAEIGGVPPVLVHGYKDQSALTIAHKWCLQPVSA